MKTPGLRTLGLPLIAVTFVLGQPVPVTDMVPAGLTNQAHAEEDDNVRRTPAMRQNVHKRFSRIRELADKGKLENAFEVWERMDPANLNSYERAMRWNLAAFLHHQRSDNEAIANAYRKLLEQTDIPLSLEQDTWYSLARVEMVRGSYEAAMEALDEWFALQEDPGANAYALKAQLHYRQENWRQSLDAINRAIEVRHNSGDQVAKNWYLLKRGILYQQEDYEGLASVLEILVREYPQKSYLMQLSSVYGELDRPAEQLAVREAAYEKGYLDKESELVGLAQLMASQDSPYRAAEVLRKGIEGGRIEATRENLERMGDNFLVAKEYDKAIDAFKQAAAKTDNGKLYLRMAQVAADLGDWDEAEQYAARAVERGDFDRLGRAHVVRGLALYHLERFSESLQSLEQARGFEDTRKMATQWHDYVQKEQKRREQLEASATSGIKSS
ncbi:tetratricopeptide repeat protein [Salicola sp. Rm-C-2C1-2]|uniref:tetratricopeptide repeat protein n=1 Tax=Salicola sp. Rm-C-2C1-2 TaxID=3141321 RepID=UPI0032E4EC23